MRPVWAAVIMASIISSTCSSGARISSLVLGRKSTTYSAPRYSSVCPFWRPKPFTSVTVIPCTPIADSASRTSSSLNGLMIAVTSFMCKVPCLGCRYPRRSEFVERLDREGDQALAEVGAIRENGLVGSIRANLAAQLEVVGRKIANRHGEFLVLRRRSRPRREAEVETILVVECLGTQRASQFRHKHVRGIT